MLSPSAPPAPLEEGGFDVPIDTEPPTGMNAQSGHTEPPPPERAAPGTAPGGVAAVPAPAPVPDPTPVDFDALHAALGEGSREAAAPMPTPQVAPATPGATGKGGRPVAADSQGRSSATYASSRAQAPPAAHVDVDLQAPAVIVAQDDVVPPSPQMTTPMAPPMVAMAMSPNHPSSGPHRVGTPSSGGMRAVPPHGATGNTPQAFNPAALGLPPVRPGQVALTMRMPERPRRPRTPTVVVRPRGPSARQKFFVFSVMLVLVSLIGLAIVLWRAPQLFGFGPKTAPAVATTAKPAVTAPPAATTTATPTTAATASAASAPSAAPSASANAGTGAPAKPGFKPKGK